ncbi:uncharacterized protein LOC116611902 [Nematostella vectensis]|uniref:uncharacterized protein LOC116611902 n=1 Tax=Nematostella vectensis TaxID=45351 RepID=UPI0013901987|nr:uncharacterized protein LOC116611902 [Nematostella vectensis]
MLLTRASRAVTLMIGLCACVTKAHKEDLDCQLTLLKDCNENFKAVFVAAKDISLADAYCRAFEGYAKKLTEDDCGGKIIDLDRNMIYQHMAMDGKAGVCNYGSDFELLKERVRAIKKYKKEVKLFENTEIDSCSVEAHLTCSKEFKTSFHRSDVMFCDSINRFVECYEIELKNACDKVPKMAKEFLKTLEKVGKELLKIFKKTGTMPGGCSSGAEEA